MEVTNPANVFLAFVSAVIVVVIILVFCLFTDMYSFINQFWCWFQCQGPCQCQRDSSSLEALALFFFCIDLHKWHRVSPWVKYSATLWLYDTNTHTRPSLLPAPGSTGERQYVLNIWCYFRIKMLPCVPYLKHVIVESREVMVKWADHFNRRSKVLICPSLKIPIKILLLSILLH